MEIIQLILSILATLILISVLVFVHELGHFAAAKFFKMNVKEFAIGFGKRIFQKKIGGTVYAVRLLPLGGFVDLEGETDTTSPDSFRNRPVYQKIIVLIAGVVMNFILAFIGLAIFLQSNNNQITLPSLSNFTFNNTSVSVQAYPLLVTEVLADGNSVGELNEGDLIISVDGNRFQNYQSFQDLLNVNKGKTTKFEFINLDNFSITSKDITINEPKEDGSILQVRLAEFNKSAYNVAYPIYFIKYDSSLKAISLTTDLSIYLPKAIGELISRSFSTGNFTELGNSVGGPLQIANQSNEIVQSGAIGAFIPFAALLSLSLAVFNILPFPALDGGQIVVVLLEKLLRRKISDKTLETINLIGISILFLLAIVITFKDVIQLELLQRVRDFIENTF